MCFFFSFIPATGWLVAGFIVYYLAAKSEGNLQKFGKILACWVFTIAALIPVMGAYITLTGICPLEKIFGG